MFFYQPFMLPLEPDCDGFIYVATNEDLAKDNRVKIGHSIDPNRRIGQYNSATNCSYRLIAKFKVKRQYTTEQNTFVILKRFKIINEIFRIEEHEEQLPFPTEFIVDTVKRAVAAAAAVRWTCLLCKRLFFNRKSLMRHQRTHQPKLPCPICNVSVKNRPQLLNHIRTHSNNYQFECPNCKKCYTNKGSLRVHISRKHKNVCK